MKWGNRHENGCKDTKCDKLHPLLCEKSLDLKCFSDSCPHKLHTLKCKRKTQQSDSKTSNFSGPGSRSQRGSTPACHRVSPWQDTPAPQGVQAAANQRSGVWQGTPAPQGTQAAANQRGGVQVQPTSLYFQEMTVQPQLEAYMFKMRQEMQEEVRVLRSFLAREIQLAKGIDLSHSF